MQEQSKYVYKNHERKIDYNDLELSDSYPSLAECRR